MKRVYPADLPGFLRSYKFAGGRVKRVKLKYITPDELTIEFIVSARTPAKAFGEEPRAVRLRIRVAGVQEFRFQKRLSVPAGKMPDARIGYFGDAYFVNLDAFALEPGEQPKPFDYRASDAYVAGRELWWEEVAEKGGEGTE